MLITVELGPKASRWSGRISLRRKSDCEGSLSSVK
jgi:hypothetical protein